MLGGFFMLDRDLVGSIIRVQFNKRKPRKGFFRIKIYVNRKLFEGNKRGALARQLADSQAVDHLLLGRDYRLRFDRILFRVV